MYMYFPLSVVITVNGNKKFYDSHNNMHGLKGILQLRPCVSSAVYTNVIRLSYSAAKYAAGVL